MGLFIVYKLTAMQVAMITATYSAKCYNPGGYDAFILYLGYNDWKLSPLVGV